MSRQRQNKRARLKSAAIASGRPPIGKAALYAERQAKRDARRASEVAALEASTRCGYAFGARCEAQFLALARTIAALMAKREALESDPDYQREQLLQESARGFLEAQKEQTRALRSNGIAVRWRDAGGDLELSAYGLSELPAPGWWDQSQWELGLIELKGLSLPKGQVIAIGHASGDLKQKNFERAREIRFYHPLGDELDPEGDSYFRLIGHIPANLPLAAIKACVRHLIDKWGENPADWAGVKTDRNTGRPMRDAQGEPVFEPLFDRLARKTKYQQKA